MSRAALAEAFNRFWREHDFCPKPDPASNENSMAGMNPYSAGMGDGEIIFCQLSPLHAITLDSETKAAANIPIDATSFAWAYPMVLEPGTARPRGVAEAAFIDFGGYMYFNDHRKVVGTNAIVPAPLGTLGLMFGRPQPLLASVADTLTKQGRFQEITLKALADKEATHFAWIRPGEFSDEIANVDGCFAYKFLHDQPKYFPVVSKPIFTKELLEEELDESEAWIVVRYPKPALESAIIFDKRKSLEENMYNNEHGLQVGDDVSLIRIGRDKHPSLAMTYEEWTSSMDQASLEDPFVFHLAGGAAEEDGPSSAAAEVLGICM
jgi:hypothetical protein